MSKIKETSIVKKGMNKIKTAIRSLYLSVVMFCISASAVYAESIGESKPAKGTIKLLNDATTWILIALPIIAVLLIIYFAIRRNCADDDHETKKWEKRIKSTIVCVIVGVSATGIVAVVTYYYQ